MASPLHDPRVPSRPMSVEQIVRKAENFDYNPLIPLKYWLRTAGTLLKEAEIYEHEGNDQQTYLLLYRHAQLVLKNLSSNPDAKHIQNRVALAQASKEVNSNLKKLEVLKPRINKRYERYEQLMRDRDARKAAAITAPQNSRATTPIGHKRGFSDPAITDDTETLAAADNRDLAVKLAHREIKRRATARKATRQAGISEEVEHERRTAGMWGDWEEALANNDDRVDRETLSQQMQNVRSQVNGSSSQKDEPGSRHAPMEGQASHYRYPTVPDHHKNQDWRRPSFPEPHAYEIQAAQRAPELPPKEHGSFLFDATPPDVPEKRSLSNPPNNRPAYAPPSPPSPPPPPPGPKPSEFTFKASAYLENGSPLRTIFLPPDLRRQFLSIASPNTRANRETCGILCGTLVSNALFISKLVIPEQESTSDTCEMINESEFFDYVDGEDLMVLGWIHTHPTQTCFMSSRDLHTHGGYQVMMPESIAIVCAPSQNDWGVFRLTDPPGMKAILNCTQTGLFHPHVESHLYTDALRPGHVYEAKGLEFDVVDLRPK